MSDLYRKRLERHGRSTAMKKILTVLAILALTGGGAFAADKILKGDQFVVAGVNFPQPFQTPSGQVLKAGLYDLKVVSDGTEGVLIGLLKGGKQVGQLRGTVMQGGEPYCGGCYKPQKRSGGPGMAHYDHAVTRPAEPGAGDERPNPLPVDQGIKLQPTPRDGKAGSGTDPQNAPKAFRDLGFSPASPVSFGGGLGKISNSNTLQPGGANAPSIEFAFVPAVQKK
jgi:hypothetical protein